MTDVPVVTRTAAAAQHRSIQQHNHHKQEQPTEQAMKEGERNQSKEEEKAQEERERGERGKEEEKDAEEEGREQVKKDVTSWTVVKRNKREGKQIQREEDVYVTLHGRVLKRSEKLKSCEVTDGCMIQVTSRLELSPKRKPLAKVHALFCKGLEQVNGDKSKIHVVHG